MSDSIRDYFKQTAPEESAEFVWRMRCYTSGEELADLVERTAFPVAGKEMLDVAAGWGGHLLAFAERGANTVAADLNDHTFAALQKYARGRGLHFRALVGNCESTPFASSSFDIILGLELIEHIESVESFAREVARILKPGGVAIMSTPPRFKVFFEGEPHYGLRFLPILPFALQGIVARKLFKKSYPFPIRRQYLLASNALSPFVAAGLKGEAMITGRLSEIGKTNHVFREVAEQLMFKYLIVRRPS